MSTNAYEPPQRHVPGRPPAASGHGHVTITHVDVMQSAKCLAAAATVFTIPLLLLGLANGSHMLVLLLMPAMNWIVSFISGLISAFCYNLAAGWVGGVSFRQDRIDSRD